MIKLYPVRKIVLRYLIFSIPVLFLLGSCQITKHLNEGQQLVTKNKVKIKSKEKITDRRALEYELETIVKQLPNEKFLGLFRTRLWFYFRTDDPGDTTKIDRWIQRKIAEPPTIYDVDITERTARSMKYYLQNRGYFDAEVDFKIKEKRNNKKVIVNYTVDPHQRYLIDSVSYICKDFQIQRILKDTEEESFLKSGDPVSVDLYNKEVDRISTTLRNLGYANFDPSYIDALTGDSTNHKVNLTFTIFTPKDLEAHQIFHIGKVQVDTDYKPALDGSFKIDTLIKGIHFVSNNDELSVNPQNILQAISLREGVLYSDEALNRTNSQLRKLDYYKYITIDRKEDPNDPQVLNFLIRMTPRKKLVIGADLEINNSNYDISNTSSSIFGTSVNLNFRNRNFLNNASVFSASVQGGIEFNFEDPDNLIYSLDLLAQGNWDIPRYVPFTNFYRGVSRLPGLQSLYPNLSQLSQTRVSASYNRLLLFNFYSFNSFNGSFGYDLQLSPRKRLRLNQAGVNYLAPEFEPDFEVILDSNPFLRSSFTDQLFTGLFFRDLSFDYSSRTNIRGHSWAAGVNFEASGLEIMALNSLYNLGFEDYNFRLFNSVDFSRYLRLEANFRAYFNINEKQSMAFRVASSVAVSLQDTIEVPYVKQFIGGNQNTMRGWRYRELGPGEFVDPLTIDNPNNVPFYQSGDFLLEMNAEYRFDILSYFKGAFFLDIGNIWTLKYDELRPGSQLLWRSRPDPNTGEMIGNNFLKQLAVGTGFGLRGDFSYFIIRFDLGLKMRNPFPDEEGNYWLIDTWSKLQFNDFNYNLAIGYPF